MANSSEVPRRLGNSTPALSLSLNASERLARAVDRRVDEAGGDAVDPDADGGEVAGDGQGHADDAALGGRVGGLADLAVEGGDRGDVDDGAPLAVRRRGSFWLIAVAAMRMQLKVPTRLTSMTFLNTSRSWAEAYCAVLADGAGGPADAGRVDEGPQRAHLLGRLDGGDDLVGVGHVGVGEDAADVRGDGLALLVLHVGDDDLGAPLGEQPSGGLTEAGGAAGDDR